MSKALFWKMTSGKVVEGVFAVNKPTGISSAQVIRDLQHHFNKSELFAPWLQMAKNARAHESNNQRKRRKEKNIQVKIGHGGTLDPLATGVLITGVGRGTKSLQDFLLCTKEYEAVVLFGAATDSYDRVGKVLKTAPTDHITKELVEGALDQFRGKFMQLPPLFSALKMNGKPLYEYAREGKEIPRAIERRPVEVLNLELLEWMEGGTHDFAPPTEEAGRAEINVANQLWKQEGASPNGKKQSPKPRSPSPIPAAKTEDTEPSMELRSGATITDTKPSGEEAVSTDSSVEIKLDKSEEDPLQSFERQKRKLNEDQDDLISDRPPTKSRKANTKSASSTPPQDTMMSGALPPSESAKHSTPPITTSEPKPKGPPAIRLRMTVTSGFYVRSLCHDLGAAVGSAALMSELERTRQGDYEVGKNTLEYADLHGGEEVWGPKVEAWCDEWEAENPTGLRPRGGVPRKETMEKIKEKEKGDVASDIVAAVAVTELSRNKFDMREAEGSLHDAGGSGKRDIGGDGIDLL